MTNIKITFYFTEQGPLSLKASNFSPVSAIVPIRYRRKYFTIIHSLQYKIQNFLQQHLLYEIKYVYKEKIKVIPLHTTKGHLGAALQLL
jgi:hypothetical protein